MLQKRILVRFGYKGVFVEIMDYPRCAEKGNY